jgi:hypothetical protein
LFVTASPKPPPPKLGLAETFDIIVGNLCKAIAAKAAKDLTVQALLVLLHGRLRRVAKRFAALVARVQAGPLPAPRHRAARESKPRPRPPAFPTKFAWLLRLVPEAASFGSQLHHLLADPEMVALLKTAPQAGRILRPLCRLLAQKPIPSLLPPPPRTARAAPARTTKAPGPAPPPATPPGATPGATPSRAAPTGSGPPNSGPPGAGPPGAGPPGAGPPGAVPPEAKPKLFWRRWRGIRRPQMLPPPKPA